MAEDRVRIAAILAVRKFVSSGDDSIVDSVFKVSVALLTTFVAISNKLFACIGNISKACQRLQVHNRVLTTFHQPHEELCL
jgi:hypothetical protein